MRNRILFRLTCVICCIFLSSNIFAQVDGTQVRQDTLYIYEEEVSYDTVYLYDTIAQPALMNKEELIDAFRQNRDIGQLYYNKGRMYLTGSDTAYRLDNADLKRLFSSSDYSEYQKAKWQRYSSIPLFVCAGGSAVYAGMGFYQFAASFIQTSKYGDYFLESGQLGQGIWSCAMGGLFVFIGGALVTTIFAIPASVLLNKGKTTIHRITDNFNKSKHTSFDRQLRVGPSPGGLGLTLSF